MQEMAPPAQGSVWVKYKGRKNLISWALSKHETNVLREIIKEMKGNCKVRRSKYSQTL
jgi:hypothetical protein